MDFSEGSVVYMKTVQSANGESTKLHVKYRGPVVFVQKLPSDTYRVVDISTGAGGHRYASTPHASQLNSGEPASSDTDDSETDEPPDLEITESEDAVQLDHKEIEGDPIDPASEIVPSDSENQENASDQDRQFTSSPAREMRAAPDQTSVKMSAIPTTACTTERTRSVERRLKREKRVPRKFDNFVRSD